MTLTWSKFVGCVEKLDGDAGTGDLDTRGRQDVGLGDFET